MNKFKFYFILSVVTIAIISCSKKDDDEVAPPRDYATQYKTDIAAIEEYLQTHYLEDPDNPDVNIKKITDSNTQKSIMSYLNSEIYPKLLIREVKANRYDGTNDITYKLYYLIIKEGKKGENGPIGLSPCNVDGVYTAYKGTLLDGTVFDSSNNGQSLYNLDRTNHDGGVGVIRGWSEAFPKFTAGWVAANDDDNDDGTISYNDFGVGVMFLPSGLGYYNIAKTDIPAYSPLVFSIKFYALKRYDHDADGIPSYQEDVDSNHDGYMYRLATGVPNPDDTDKDGIPDFLDFDDDGDGYATRGEIKDANGKYYPYDGALKDDPSTPTIDESYGIPRQYALKDPNLPESETNPRVSKPSDFTDPKRLRRHLDPNCHVMNQ